MRQTLVVLSLLALSLSFVSAATVSGKTVGTDGRPIKGVSVRLFLFGERKSLELLSDAEGGFSVDVAIEDGQSNDYLASIVAYAPGYALTSGWLKAQSTVITLSAGATLSGTVVDTAGKPLAGVPVKFRYAQCGNERAAVPDEWRARFTAVTAADGGWTLSGIPLEGTASIVLDDDRYVHEGAELSLVAGEKAAPVQLTARPGAVVSGRVLTPEGRPAVNARVNVTTPINSTATSGYGKTAADGSYRFSGLATGTYSISAFSDEQAWIAEPLKEIALREGKQTAVADLRAHAGAVLEGTVVDAETGTPIPNTFISLFTDKKCAFTARFGGRRADKSGHFLFRTPPAQLTLLVDTPRGSYQKQQDTEAQTVDLQEGKTVTITVKLHKGLSITGTVTDDDGQPAAGVNFIIQMLHNPDGQWSRNDASVNFTTDQFGHFTAAGLPAGKGTLTLFPDYGKVNEWAQPAPLAIEVPAKEPLIVRVTHIALRTLSGRVVDTRQQPLAGVAATFSVSIPRNPDPLKLTAVTGADGDYGLAKIPAGARVSLLSLSKPGYRQLRTGTLSSTGKDTLDDAVMTACTATVHGKVCGADGKAVQGATVVSVEGGLAARAVTDAAGAFTLAAQPEGDLHLIAATADSGGLATCTANAPVVITCTPGAIATPTDIPLALKLLDADSMLPTEQRRFNRADTLHALADVNFEQANKLAMAGEEPLPDGLRAYLLAKGAEKDPAHVELAQLNLLQNSECKLYAAVEVGIAVVKTDPELAEQLYQIAKPIYERTTHGDAHGVNNIEGLGMFADISLRTITLAALLHKTADLDAMLAALNAQAKQSNGMGYMLIQPLLEAAVRVNPEFVFQVYDGIDDRGKSGYLGQAVMSMASRDPTAALRLLTMIAAKESDRGGYTLDVLPVISALGKTDPAAALAAAKAQQDNVRPMALLEAAASQAKDAARTIMLTVFAEEDNRTIMNLAKANAIDPEVAKELYSKYKPTLDAESYHFSHRFRSDISSTVGRVQYAYLISSIDPVEARLILETEYTTALGKTPQGAARFTQQLIPQAMCALDLQRAEAMLATLNVNDPAAQAFFRKWMIQYILMPRAERVSVSLL